MWSHLSHQSNLSGTYGNQSSLANSYSSQALAQYNKQQQPSFNPSSLHQSSINSNNGGAGADPYARAKELLSMSKAQGQGLGQCFSSLSQLSSSNIPTVLSSSRNNGYLVAGSGGGSGYGGINATTGRKSRFMSCYISDISTTNVIVSHTFPCLSIIPCVHIVVTTTASNPFTTTLLLLHQDKGPANLMD